MTGLKGRRVVLLAALATFGGCKSTTLNKGRCDNASDCSSGLSCDNLHTCVPITVSSAPCSNNAQCGSEYACDNLQWCVCQVPNSNLSASADPCSNGTLPPYRGLIGDGGMPDAKPDTGDAGPICSAANCPSPKACTDAGVCIECSSDSQCPSPTSPICDLTTNTCGPCTTDAQCVAKLGADPGVCMFHTDGHCATSTETVYVANAVGCLSSATPGGGSPTVPFCSLGPAVPSSDVRELIVVRGTVAGSSSIQQGTLSIVGQQSAKVTPDTGEPGIQISGAAVYIRGLRITGGDSVGISAGAGATLTLDQVKVDACAGGGVLLDGAGFNIENTTVTGNGPGTFMALTTWGGLLVNNPPAGNPTKLSLLTVENNLAPGVSCSTNLSAMASGVLASGNSTADVNPTCGFSSCGGPGPTCGAQ
jgi:hypothetical protein